LHVGLKFNEDCVVVRAEGSEYIVKTATGLGHFLTQKVLRPQLFRKLVLKEKHGATYTTLEKNECSNKILVDLRSKKSEAFYRFTVAARANVLPTPANIDLWYKRPHVGCYKCQKDCPATLAHILNACEPMYAEMTRRHNRVVRVVCDAILRHQVGNISDFRENRRVDEEGLSDEVRALRPDISFVRKSGNITYTELIDISCPYGRMIYGDSSLENAYGAKISKYSRLADELRQKRQFYTNITPIIVSSLGAVYPKSLTALQTMLKCSDKDIHVIGQRMSEAAIAGSFDVWRRYMEGRPHPGDTEEGRVLDLERAISEAGEPFGVEEVPYDEAGHGIIELWDEVDRGEPIHEEGAPPEAEEADDEEGFIGSPRQPTPVLLHLSPLGFSSGTEPESAEEVEDGFRFPLDSELELPSSSGEGIGYVRIEREESDSESEAHAPVRYERPVSSESETETETETETEMESMPARPQLRTRPDDVPLPEISPDTDSFI
jgi:hypothetical protein